MIVVRLMGGLGNQMFQYAAGLRLALHRRTSLRLDTTSLLDRTKEDHTHREFGLSAFGVSAKYASSAEIQSFQRVLQPSQGDLRGRLQAVLFKRRYYREDGLQFHPEVLELPRNTYLDGFFQNEKYFVDIPEQVRRCFALSPESLELAADSRSIASQVNDSSTICVHVRRGDYVTNPQYSDFHGVCSIKYYQDAVNELRRKGATGRAFVFSDDPIWCKTHFSPADGFTVIGAEHSGRHSTTHLWLMSLCNHFVIANSSFGWWAAWLGNRTGKLVCRPSPWFKTALLGGEEICPSPWSKIPRHL